MNTSKMKIFDTVIIGAGLSGLSTAYYLKKKDYVLLEASFEVGGLATNIREDGFVFDLSVHQLHLRNEEIVKLIKELLGDELILKNRNAGILLNGRVIPYPFQYNLYHLDEKTKRECLSGVIEASKNFDKNKIPKSFDEWVKMTQGEGIAKHFMIPDNKKRYCVNADELTIEILGRFVPSPSFDEIIKGAEIDMSKTKVGFNYQFYYLKSGGIDYLPKAMAKKIQNIKLNEKAVKIDIDKKMLITNKGTYPFKNLVSTIPLKELIGLINRVPDKIKDANKKLRSSSLCLVLLGINSPNISPYHWLYLPQEDILPFRISFPMNYSEKMTPLNMSSICAEYAYIGERKFTDEEIIERTINDLIKIGIIKDKQGFIFKKVVDLKFGYVVFDFNRKDNLQLIKDYLIKNNIYSIGRYGAWEHSSMEDAIIQGKEMASKLTE